MDTIKNGLCNNTPSTGKASIGFPKVGPTSPLPSKEIDDTISNISDDPCIIQTCTIPIRRNPHMFCKPMKAIGEQRSEEIRISNFGPVHIQFVDKLEPKTLPFTSDSLIDSTLSFNGRESLVKRESNVRLQELNNVNVKLDRHENVSKDILVENCEERKVCNKLKPQLEQAVLQLTSIDQYANKN
jgi:hypothetical protein